MNRSSEQLLMQFGRGRMSEIREDDAHLSDSQKMAILHRTAINVTRRYWKLLGLPGYPAGPDRCIYRREIDKVSYVNHQSAGFRTVIPKDEYL